MFLRVSDPQRLNPVWDGLQENASNEAPCTSDRLIIMQHRSRDLVPSVPNHVTFSRSILESPLSPFDLTPSPSFHLHHFPQAHCQHLCPSSTTVSTSTMISAPPAPHLSLDEIKAAAFGNTKPLSQNIGDIVHYISQLQSATFAPYKEAIECISKGPALFSTLNITPHRLQRALDLEHVNGLAGLLTASDQRVQHQCTVFIPDHIWVGYQSPNVVNPASAADYPEALFKSTPVTCLTHGHRFAALQKAIKDQVLSPVANAIYTPRALWLVNFLPMSKFLCYLGPMCGTAILTPPLLPPFPGLLHALPESVVLSFVQTPNLKDRNLKALDQDDAFLSFVNTLEYNQQKSLLFYNTLLLTSEANFVTVAHTHMQSKRQASLRTHAPADR